MIIERIDDLLTDKNRENIQQCNNHVKNGKHLFLFLYLKGCGPCKYTKTQWDMIDKNVNPNYLQNNDIMVSQVNQELYKDLKDIGDEPSGYPTIRHIHNNNVSEYEGDRSTQSFADWIEQKLNESKKTSSHHVYKLPIHNRHSNRKHLGVGSKKINHVRQMLQMGGKRKSSKKITVKKLKNKSKKFRPKSKRFRSKR